MTETAAVADLSIERLVHIDQRIDASESTALPSLQVRLAHPDK